MNIGQDEISLHRAIVDIGLENSALQKNIKPILDKYDETNLRTQSNPSTS